MEKATWQYKKFYSAHCLAIASLSTSRCLSWRSIYTCPQEGRHTNIHCHNTKWHYRWYMTGQATKLQHVYSLRYYLAIKKNEMKPGISAWKAFWDIVKEKKQGRWTLRVIIFLIMLKKRTKPIFALYISLHRNTVCKCIRRTEKHTQWVPEWRRLRVEMECSKGTCVVCIFVSMYWWVIWGIKFTYLFLKLFFYSHAFIFFLFSSLGKCL